MTDKYRRLGPLPLRLMLALGFLYHSLPRLTVAGHERFAGLLGDAGLPSPGTAAWIIAGLEAAGALLLLVGFHVRLVVIPLIADLVFMIVKVHWPHVAGTADTPAGLMVGLPGIELNLVYVSLMIALWFLGAGRLSIDERRNRETYSKPFLIRHAEVEVTRA